MEQLKTIVYAVLGGVLPALLWLWFWLHQEDEEESEPIGMIVLTFILGAVMVMVAVWAEKYSLKFLSGDINKVVVWATIEEVVKLLAVAVLLMGNKIIRKPIDYPMYFIACALGFAALENFLYLLHPLSTDGTVVGLLTGNLRFLGSTLLHAIASSSIGIGLGLSFFIKKYRFLYLIIGLGFAVLLHSVFNFFIMKGSGSNFLSVFGLLWVVAIINILIFEKLRRMGQYLPKN